MLDSATIIKTLDRAGYQLTGQRRALAEIIASRGDRFTADDLVAQADRAKPRIGRATVFRSLEVFETLGLVERVHLVRGEHAYVLCDPARHHHHLICERCGRNTEVSDPDIGSIAQAIGEKAGYQVKSHRFEIVGLCPDCQTESPDQP